MLAQSSDWPFIITNGTTEQYARRRFHDHVHRFHDLLGDLDRQRDRRRQAGGAGAHGRAVPGAGLSAVRVGRVRQLPAVAPTPRLMPEAACGRGFAIVFPRRIARPCRLASPSPWCSVALDGVGTRRTPARKPPREAYSRRRYEEENRHGSCTHPGNRRRPAQPLRRRRPGRGGRRAAARPVYLPETNLRLDRLQAVFAVALHMQQPLIPAGGGDLRTADLISNLDAHDAQPRHRRQPQRHRLRRLLRPHGRHHPRAGPRGHATRASCSTTPASCSTACARWAAATCSTGCAASPATRTCAATSNGSAPCGATPSPPPRRLPDLKLHMRAWQHNFAAVYGWDALGRVRGFSPPEMHLPNHPDAAFEYVKALRECGYKWLLVQEHTVETLGRARPRLQAPAAPAARPQLVRRGGVDHRRHQDAGLRHQAGRADAAVSTRRKGLQRRDVGGVSHPAAGHADRRRRERRRHDERVPQRLPPGDPPVRHRGRRQRQRDRVPGNDRAGRRQGAHAAGLPADPPGRGVRAHHEMGAGRRGQGDGRDQAREAAASRWTAARGPTTSAG